MAPVLCRGLGAPSASAFVPSSSRLASNARRGVGLRSWVLPHSSVPRGAFHPVGLRWKVEKRERRMVVRCDAAVAEKEADEASGEKFEYQAEVISFLFFLFSFHVDYYKACFV